MTHSPFLRITLIQVKKKKNQRVQDLTVEMVEMLASSRQDPTEG